MALSSLTDPSDIARAQAALEAAWMQVRDLPGLGGAGEERARLGYIVAGLLAEGSSRDELAEKAVARFIAAYSRESGAVPAGRRRSGTG
jgi:hypothetical protein